MCDRHTWILYSSKMMFLDGQWKNKKNLQPTYTIGCAEKVLNLFIRNEMERAFIVIEWDKFNCSGAELLLHLESYGCSLNFKESVSFNRNGIWHLASIECIALWFRVKICSFFLFLFFVCSIFLLFNFFSKLVSFRIGFSLCTRVDAICTHIEILKQEAGEFAWSYVKCIDLFVKIQWKVYGRTFQHQKKIKNQKNQPSIEICPDYYYEQRRARVLNKLFCLSSSYIYIFFFSFTF